jgi:D-lactate dehydrogenase
MVLDTCAVDGLCATACPVSIDTGQLTKRLRKIRHSPSAHGFARYLAEHFGLVEHIMRFGLSVGHGMQSLLGPGILTAFTRTLRALAKGPVPLWTPDVPRRARRLPATEKAGAQAVYYPACISRVLGRLPGEPDDMSLMDAFITVSRRGGMEIFIPPEVRGTCCGVPFSSKGYEEAHKLALNRAIERFWEWSDHGKIPVVVDTSPCTYGLTTGRSHLTPENQKKFDQLKILDSVAFVHDHLLPRLTVNQKVKSVALHPVCSLIKMNLVPKLDALASACSERVVVPLNAGCCGFAGDRGFLFPELTESATRLEAAELGERPQDGFYSSSRTCEIGMTRATGQVYRSYLYLLEQVTREKK